MSNDTAITLVLLPGMDGTGELFTNLLAELPANLKTVVVRYPTATVLNYEELTALADLQIPKNTPYVLLGESFSGPIAIALASRATAQLKGVILSCTFAANPRPIFSKWSFLVPAVTITEKLLNFSNKLLMSSFSNEELETQLKVVLPRVSPETMRARLDAVIGVNYLAELVKINVPILYLKAKQDHLVPASASKTIAKFAKNLTLIEIDAPHLLLQVTAKQGAVAIKDFMQKLSKS